jgi:hypothetical protein
MTEIRRLQNRRLLYKYRLLVVQVMDDIIKAQEKDLANGQDRFSPSPETEVLHNFRQEVDRLLRAYNKEICGGVVGMDEEAELIEACQKVLRHSWPDCDPDTIRELDYLRLPFAHRTDQPRP